MCHEPLSLKILFLPKKEVWAMQKYFHAKEHETKKIHTKES
jgi:hypothetical protein